MNTLEKIRVLEAKRDSSRANKAAGAQAESVAKDTQKIINMLRAFLVMPFGAAYQPHSEVKP